jgi:hypothetical protein
MFMTAPWAIATMGREYHRGITPVTAKPSQENIIDNNMLVNKN